MLTPEEKLERKITRAEATLKRLSYEGRFSKNKVGVASLYQRLVRLRYADENGICRCVTCDKSAHFTELQGGHFISRRHKNTIVDERNVWPQCVYCNYHLSGNVSAFRKFLEFELGSTQLAAIESKAKGPSPNWSTRELAELKVRLAEEIKAEEKRIERHEPPTRKLKTLSDYESVADIEF